MSKSNTNPFVLPGLGQDNDLSGNPLLASMEMMRKAWAGLAGPGGLAQSLPIAPPMNLEELERRIAELRTVESWLRMNLSMLSSAIQGMEVQRSTITTLRSFVAGATGNGPSPLEIVLGLKPAQGAAKPAPASTGASSRSEPRPSTAEAPASSGDEGPAPSVGADTASMADQMNQASQAWWNLLQQQFNQIATATASSMPDPAAMQAAAEAATGAPPAQANSAPAAAPAAPRKRAPRKAAAKRAPAAPKS
ncbi:PhaM family polyhydroxyalkanoate granule multifunctional regulatory protein [Bordetella muralis]|uniref:PhaM family polyhydroxyalkanoate granule multifunctional regulatory protein n=1 Tax=Bordetella muralis TaxID=1649130 RepID=UPI0039EFC11C